MVYISFHSTLYLNYQVCGKKMGCYTKPVEVNEIRNAGNLS